MTSPDHFLAGLSIGAVYSAVCGISSHKRIPYFAAFILCGVFAMLPDIDAFRGVYSSTDPLIGHRGITHSLFFAALVSVISVIVYLSGRVVLSPAYARANLVAFSNANVTIDNIITASSINGLLANLYQAWVNTSKPNYAASVTECHGSCHTSCYSDCYNDCHSSCYRSTSRS